MDTAVLLAAAGGVTFAVIQLLKNASILKTLAQVIIAAIAIATAFVMLYAYSNNLISQKNAFDLVADVFLVATTASGIHAAADVGHSVP